MKFSYSYADSQLQGRNKQSRKIDNNTYLQRRDDGKIVVKLHKTDIVALTPDDRVTVNSGGCKTPTTKARINDVLPGGYCTNRASRIG